jgi:anion-transporting  ArsA/GET3 family ATPase
MSLLERRLIVVTGKGGVGKSAVVATLSRVLSNRGRRVLALEIDPRENLHQLFDAPPSGGEILELGPRLYLQNLKPRSVADWVVKKQVKIDLLVNRVLQSAVYHRFVEGAPGLKELAILGHALRLLRGDAPNAPQLDTVILDAPATGHGLFLLNSPKLYAESIGSGPFADLAREVADLVADRQACGLVVVTSAEEMPVQEALELRAELESQHGAVPDLLVINGLYPALPSSFPVELDEDERRLVGLWHDRRKGNDREIARLEETWSGAKVELPLLAVDRGRALLEGLAPKLEAWLVGAPAAGEGGP